MAISFDNFTQSDASGSGTGTTPFTVTNAGNLMLVAIYWDSLGENVDGTGVQYNGNVFTNLYDNKMIATGLWVGYLFMNPPITGSHTMNVTFTGAVTVFRVGVISFNNVNLDTQIGGSNSNTDTGSGASSLSTTVTVTGTSGIIVDFFDASRVDTANAVSPQIEKMNNTGTYGGGVNHISGISYEAHTGSNITMGWENFTNQGGTTKKQIFAVELLPGSSGPPGQQIIFI